MADLPRYFARPTGVEARLPRPGPEAFGAGLFHTLGQLADDMKEKQKPIDVAMHSSQYDIEIEDLKNSLQAEPDPNTWRDKFMAGEKEIRANRLGQIADAETQKGFKIHADRRYADNVRTVLTSQIAASHQKQLQDIAIVGQGLSKQAGETDDPSVRASSINTYNALINTASTPTMIDGRPTPAAITPLQAEQYRQKFNNDILVDRGKFLGATNPYKLRDEITQGIYKGLPLEQQAAVMESSRLGIQNREATSDRNTAQARDLIMREARAKAYFGLLSDAFIIAVMENKDPFLKPEDGEALKKINDNPPTGAGSDTVRAIMQTYHGGESSPARIRAARKQLNDFALSLGKPNDLIDKALNELQTDERTMYGIEASRVNRNIQAAQDEYEATTPKLPFNMPFFNNQRDMDKAKIRTETRKGGDWKAVVEQKAKESKAKVDAIPNRNKKVMDLP